MNIQRQIESTQNEIGLNEWVNRLWHAWSRIGIIANLDFVLEITGFYEKYAVDSEQAKWVKERLTDKIIWLEF